MYLFKNEKQLEEDMIWDPAAMEPLEMIYALYVYIYFNSFIYLKDSAH